MSARSFSTSEPTPRTGGIGENPAFACQNVPFYGTSTVLSVLCGLHRLTRDKARNVPLINPCFSNAIAAYSEHDGWNRQAT